MKRKITFREVCELEELEECLLLRYEYFNRSQYRFFLSKNEVLIDIDEFDAYSRHWVVLNKDRRIVGYARIVQTEKNLKILDLLQKIRQKYSLAAFQNIRDAYIFPMLAYQPEETRKSLSAFVSANSGKRLFELSRFIVKRGSPILISRFMVNAGLSIYKNCFNAELIILSCIENHKTFWSRYKFEKVKQAETYIYDNYKSVNLFSDLNGVGMDLENKFTDLSDQYNKNKKISIEI